MTKKKISKARANLIVEDILEKLNPYFRNLSSDDGADKVILISAAKGIIFEALEKYFEIVEIDTKEIGFGTMGEDFAV